jgi:hypothetical protein
MMKMMKPAQLECSCGEGRTFNNWRITDFCFLAPCKVFLQQLNFEESIFLVLLRLSKESNTVPSQLWSLDDLEDKALARASEITVCELHIKGILNLFFSFLFYTYINPLHIYPKEGGREGETLETHLESHCAPVERGNPLVRSSMRMIK